MITQNKRVYNTFGIDVSAAYYVDYSNTDELKSALEVAQKPYLHIGGGSNLLFSTPLFNGTIFHNISKDIDIICENSSEVIVKVGGGFIWDRFVAYTVDKGWYGAENLSLIPGEVGAAAVQNIGAYGVEAKDIITSVETYNIESGDIRVFDNSECGYGYRKSIFKEDENKHLFVLSVTFKLSKVPIFTLSYGNLSVVIGDKPAIGDVRNAIISIRKSKLPDPYEIGSAGSFFMNPVVSQQKFNELINLYPSMPHYDAPDGVKLAASWLIDQCGWRGKSLGPAGVYHKQALVLVNLGGATGADILKLAKCIVSDVEIKFGITLRMEAQVI